MVETGSQTERLSQESRSRNREWASFKCHLSRKWAIYGESLLPGFIWRIQSGFMCVFVVLGKHTQRTELCDVKW